LLHRELAAAEDVAADRLPYPHPYERLCWMHASLIEIEGDALARDTMEALGLR
jgi:hypothetical protein